MRRRLVIVILCAIVAIPVLYWYVFIDMGHLPKGVRIGSYPSPNGAYTVHAYLCSGNATNGESIRCEVTTRSGSKNIYWKYDETSAECKWLTDRVIEINGIRLDVTKDTYDWRRSKNESHPTKHSPVPLAYMAGQGVGF